ncbi:hypothetical protein CEK26_003221 [Fusarium fujikuroi]|uniref:Uncharacterized protein n=1 Tax=Fusarium fujikuroi TaxID=5127 RepID=A0A2H3S747_FUSFU|nr:uncharacterized protein Y057_15095 [Fusarium fujikuroi]KLP18117.1 uncharacterized protein LW94_9030 [Fusarium fujikuroi]QGI70887.1 hypothetical protein CEK27_003216 [Fusarium fujikuroi]QGJ01777.1 hypothetical protein CEK26_003221 [Fusarium fujikuroi]SCN69972.1 uncharacterized protein FFE2_01823 [Fusarium fujikuroi]
MARQLVAFLAAAAAFSGVSAGPCKPASSIALSSTILVETTTAATSHDTASSTITADVTETTATDATTDATATTDALDTTITGSTTDSATAGSITTFLTTTTEQSLEQSTTTTTAGPVGPGPCLEEQVLYNPSFDDNNNGWPWDLDSGVQVSSLSPRSPSYCLYNTPTSDNRVTTFSQALPALGDYEYELVYYLSLKSAQVNGLDFSCYANAFVNGKRMRDSGSFDQSSPSTYQRVGEVFTPQNSDDAGELRFEIQCDGEFEYADLAVDDVSLTRRCNA